MKKSDRIDTFLASLEPDATMHHPCYTGWFQCFNRGEYFEAHDVLEQLWLRTTGPDYAFYKGLIQLAGAFVHLRKQHARPHHPKDGRRLAPAARLFVLARKNVEPFAPVHHDLHVARVVEFIEQWIHALEQGGARVNPWSPDRLPQLHLEKASS